MKSLFSPNDFKELEKAMARHEEKYLIRTLGDLMVSARTCRVCAPWLVDIIVQVEMEKKDIFWTQNFRTVDAAKEAMNRWEARFHWIS